MYHDWVEVICWTCVRSKMPENERSEMGIGMKAYTINKGEHEVVNIHAVEANRVSGCTAALILNMGIRLS